MQAQLVRFLELSYVITFFSRCAGQEVIETCASAAAPGRNAIGCDVEDPKRCQQGDLVPTGSETWFPNTVFCLRWAIKRAWTSMCQSEEKRTAQLSCLWLSQVGSLFRAITS